MLPDFLPDYGRGEVNLQCLLGFPNGEHWIVVPGVVGSNPISHPSTLASAGVFCASRLRLGWELEKIQFLAVLFLAG